MDARADTGPSTERVERAQRGDGAAFDELYERNVDRVYAICLRLVADPRLAQELTQDVFVRAWRRIGSFRGDSRFSTWLYRLAVNVVLDAQRRRGREARRSADLEADPGKEARMAVSGWEAEARMELERAIAALPERARTALVLYAVEGYAYEEVAELMDVAVGTVGAHIHAARAKLLEELGR